MFTAKDIKKDPSLVPAEYLAHPVVCGKGKPPIKADDLQLIDGAVFLKAYMSPLGSADTTLIGCRQHGFTLVAMLPRDEELTFEGSDGQDSVDDTASVTPRAMQLVRNFGKGSQLFYNFLTLAMLTSLRTYCDGLDIQYYKKRGHNYAAAPKVEFFKLDDTRRRPVYAWGQHTNNDQNFRDHAGYIMPSLLADVAAIIEKQYSLEADYLNHCIVILNETGGQGVPPHNDKHADSQFWNISLGFTRIMEICKSQKGGGGAHVTDLDLLDNSMLYIDRDDNHDYTHAIKHSKNILDGSVRYSIVFRHITDTGKKDGERFIPFDEVQAARFRPGGDLFFPYKRINTGTS